MLSVFVLLSYDASSNKSLVGQDSKNISDTSDASHSTQGDPSGSPKKDPESNKPNKSYEIENSSSLAKSPVYPHTSVPFQHITASLGNKFSDRHYSSLNNAIDRNNFYR